jgi:hypothetical protein
MTSVLFRQEYQREPADHYWFKWQRPSRREKWASAKKGKPSKAVSFSTWLDERIPGKPKSAAGGYEKAVTVAVLEVHEGNRCFARFLNPHEPDQDGWRVVEQPEAFSAWQLIDPQGALVCAVAFWTDRASGRPFGIGQDATGSRWWLTPVNPDDTALKFWNLKRQSPVLVPILPAIMATSQSSDREIADAAVAAFRAAGKTVTKLANHAPQQPQHRGKGLRKWVKRSDR